MGELHFLRLFHVCIDNNVGRFLVTGAPFEDLLVLDPTEGEGVSSCSVAADGFTEESCTSPWKAPSFEGCVTCQAKGNESAVGIPKIDMVVPLTPGLGGNSSSADEAHERAQSAFNFSGAGSRRQLLVKEQIQ